MRENLWYVAAAYVVMWTAVLGYLWRVRGALARARTALDEANRAHAAAGAAGGAR